MAKLLEVVEPILGPTLEPGEELVDAVKVTRVKDPDLPGGAAAKARNEAYKQLGVSQAMVWVLTNKNLVFIKASPVTGKPSTVLSTHVLNKRRIQKIDVHKRGAGFGKYSVTLSIVGLPLAVQGQKDDIDEFIEKLWQHLDDIPGPGNSVKP